MSGRGNHEAFKSRAAWLGLIGICSAALVFAVELNGQEALTVWNGVYSEAQAKRAQPGFTENCAACHGEDLVGDLSSGVPPLVGDAFLKKWDTKTLDELFTLIKTTMPQHMPGSLSDDAYRDSLAYMLQVNSFPAGSEELKADVEALKKIKIVKTKP